jgi:hypothetical protein
MQTCTAIEAVKPNLPALPESGDGPVDLTPLVAASYQEAEASLSLELDRIKALMAKNPLEGLAQFLIFMQQVNCEMIKALAPALMRDAQAKADAFLGDGSFADDRRAGARTLIGFLRLQEATAKLGVALVKVRDEQERRIAG